MENEEHGENNQIGTEKALPDDILVNVRKQQYERIDALEKKSKEQRKQLHETAEEYKQQQRKQREERFETVKKTNREEEELWVKGQDAGGETWESVCRFVDLSAQTEGKDTSRMRKLLIQLKNEKKAS